ncbi:MAG: hypothetical protein DDG58_13090 [Ardenticatenia bacterium]|nr:MAG: hypothetical protein DDG58_13090 [Ardenticatenia bacterium]
MKIERFGLRFIPVLLLVFLVGCQALPNPLGGHSTPTPEQRLSLSTWPTPLPSTPTATPTPFPKVTLPPTPTRTLPSRITPTAVTETTDRQLSFSGNPQELVAQVVALSGGFTPTGAAVVTGNGVPVRQGPGEDYPTLGSPQAGEMVAVLGKNRDGTWLYVLTQRTLQGWMPATALRVTFSLAEPPTLEDQPQPPSTPQSALSELVSKLSPVASGVVIADGMVAHQGPGSNYARAAEIGKGELLGIFGVNANRDWAYIVTISGALGWVPVDGLRIIGSLEGAPVLPANPIMRQPAQPKATAAPQAAASPLSVAQLAEVAQATVKSEQLNMRQGPGPDYRVLRTLQRGDKLSIRALNRARDWALVVTGEGKPGWVYLEYLDVTGSLESAPVVRSAAPSDALPADDIAPFTGTAASGTGVPLPQSKPTSAPAANPGVSNTTVTSTPSVALPLQLPLVPVGTARPARGEVTLYRGPGSAYAPVATLYQDDQAAVLAMSRDSNAWLLLLPSNKSPGWAMRSELVIEGSWESAPQVMTAWVASNEIALREQPGIAYPRNGVLTINTLVIVLGLDKSRGWALVAPLQGSAAGWVGLRFLSPGGSWSDLPELPSDVLLRTSKAAPQTQAAAPSSQLTESGRGLLAIQLSSGGDIVLINADGSGLRRLTSGIDPVLSPDGSQVAFTRWNGEDGSIWVINVDGSGERAILGATKQAKHPAWSPDGSRIVVNFQHGGRLEEKEVCKNLIEIKMRDKMPNIPWNVDPDSIKVKIRNRMPYLCWVLPPDPYWGLRVVNLADGSYQDLPSDNYAFGPEWDPANNWRIVSSGQGGLVQLDINRLEQWALTDRREDRTPAFSPDGRYIAVAYRQNGGYDIYRLNADGSGRVRLTQTPLWVTAMPEGGRQWNNVSPTWSPDGSQIAFLTDRTGRWEVWVMNWDGSNPHPMFPPEVNDQLPIRYDFVDERVISWR